MYAADRRIAPRFRIAIPLHFHLAKSSEPESAAETLDVSSRGVCMETDAPPGIGAILEVRLRLPEMIMGWRAPEWRITGHVVHVELSSEPGKYGVGVQFHYYEAMTPQRGRPITEVNAARVLLIADSGAHL
jgi:PilZ domain